MLDNLLTSLTSVSGAVTSAQTNLMQGDLPKISTHLLLDETLQTALDDTISQLGSGSLFQKLS
jgi:hypothetical protein